MPRGQGRGLEYMVGLKSQLWTLRPSARSFGVGPLTTVLKEPWRALLGPSSPMLLRILLFLDLKKKTSFAKFLSGPLESSESKLGIPNLSKTVGVIVSTWCHCINHVGNIFRKLGNKKVEWIESIYWENPEASVWAMEGTHFTRLSLDLLRDLQALPGDTVLWLAPGGRGHRSSQQFPFAVGLLRWIGLQQIILCSLHLLRTSVLLQEHDVLCLCLPWLPSENNTPRKEAGPDTISRGQLEREPGGFELFTTGF